MFVCPAFFEALPRFWGARSGTLGPMGPDTFLLEQTLLSEPLVY